MKLNELLRKQVSCQDLGLYLGVTARTISKARQGRLPALGRCEEAFRAKIEPKAEDLNDQEYRFTQRRDIQNARNAWYKHNTAVQKLMKSEQELWDAEDRLTAWIKRTTDVVRLTAFRMELATLKRGLIHVRRDVTKEALLLDEARAHAMSLGIKGIWNPEAKWMVEQRNKRKVRYGKKAARAAVETNKGAVERAIEEMANRIVT